MGSEDLIGDGDGDDWWQISGSVLHGEGEATQAQREKETEAEDDAIRWFTERRFEIYKPWWEQSTTLAENLLQPSTTLQEH